MSPAFGGVSLQDTYALCLLYMSLVFMTSCTYESSLAYAVVYMRYVYLSGLLSQNLGSNIYMHSRGKSL